jgi:hypothetical protein
VNQKAKAFHLRNDSNQHQNSFGKPIGQNRPTPVYPVGQTRRTSEYEAVQRVRTDKTEWLKTFRGLSEVRGGDGYELLLLGVEAGPVAGLNEAGPIEGMLAALALQHRQLGEAEGFAPAEAPL